MSLRVLFTLVPGVPVSPIAPERMTAGAAGWDLAAHLPEGRIELAPGMRKAIRTGVRVAVPPGFEAQVRPRSGLARRFGVTVLNSPGTIDSDYRGEIEVLLINHGPDPFVVRHGDRIAQLVVAVALVPEFVEVADLDDVPTPRGSAGFGSTGVQTEPQRCACADAAIDGRPPALEDEFGVRRCVLCDQAVSADGLPTLLPKR